MNNLYWYYVQSKKADDVVGQIKHLLSQNGSQKSRISIIQQLLQQDIITLIEYDTLMKYEDATYQKNLQNPSIADSGIDIKDSQECKPSDDIQILKELIIKENKRNILQWLQHVLLECIYAKLMIKEKEDPFSPPPSASIIRPKPGYIIEPIAYHCISKNKSIPIVPWNSDHSAMMQYHPFVLLLHKLGFHLPADSGSVYPRVPEFWTADLMYTIALKLGSVAKGNITVMVKSILLSFFVGTLKFEISQDQNFMEMSTESMNKDDINKTTDGISSFAVQLSKSQLGIR